MSQINESLESKAKEKSFDKMTKAQQAIIWRISASLCSLIGALAEAQDDILMAISQNDGITGFLLGLLSREFVDPAALDELLSCMITLTEDNTPFCEELQNATTALDLLLKQKDLDGTTSVLVCGVLHNVFAVLGWNDNKPGVRGVTDRDLIPRLAITLQDYKGEGAEKKQNGGDWIAPSEIVTIAIEVLAAIATSIQDTFGTTEEAREPRDVDVAVEEDEEMKDADMEDADEQNGSGNKDSERGDDDDGDKSMDDEAIAEDMEAVLGNDEADARIDDLPTLEIFLKKALPQVLRLAGLEPKSEDEMAIKIHAVSVLNNLAWSLSCVDFSKGQNVGLRNAWRPHAGRIWEKVVTAILDSDTEDLELATEITSLSWALARALGEDVPLKEGQHKKFISLYHAAKKLEAAALNNGNADGEEKKQIADDDDPFQTLGVKCIGVLGQLALHGTAPVALNRDVGVFLVAVVSALPETRAAEAVEALNQLFDVYGDEDAACDKEVFWKDNFLKHLEASAAKVKVMLRGIHKHEEKTRELRARAEEVVMNLDRFIAYKKKHRPS